MVPHSLSFLDSFIFDLFSQVKALAAVGADPNAADLEGSTPLFAAANLKSASLVTALLEAGADPRRADFNGRTPVSNLWIPCYAFTHFLISKARKWKRWVSRRHLTDQSTYSSIMPS
jgi:hypothetical protein